jgi:penicillin-binding protein 1C
MRKISLIAIAVIVMALWFIPLGPDLEQSYTSSRQVFDKDNRLLRMTLSKDQKYRYWVKLNHIPKPLVEAFLLKEDRSFYYHPGVNPLALIRSIYQTYIIKNGVYGGSTITMQLARLHYNLSTRSISGKLNQILHATWLELLYSKEQILEAWLNLIPMGRNIEGVYAGSRIYFQKDLNDVNLTDILLLAVIPQNPSTLNALTKSGPIPTKLKNKRNELFKKWAKHFPDKVNTGLSSLFEMPYHLYSIDTLPFEAPHFTTEMLAQHDSKNIKTTLDSKLQNLVEHKIEDYIRRHSSAGLNNAAAILVHSKSRKILASVGSADFHNHKISGQVNGINAKRSPGSTLKPLLFALAFDQGLIIPQSLVIDGPTDFVSPKNFDQSLLGPISAEQALYLSRNIPATDLLRQVKSPRLYDVLKTLGISKIKPKGHYGSSLILGALELTPKEIAFLYTIIAENGLVAPLQSVEVNSQLAQRSKENDLYIVSPSAAVMTKDILGKTPRPNQHFDQNMIAKSKDVYWKTGTSFGFKDAWTAGVYGPYTLVVWVGDFAGRSNTQFIGAKSAAPLFFEIIDSLSAGDDSEFNHEYADKLSSVEVCNISGQLPNKFCPKTKESLFIPGVSPIHQCKVHRLITINAKTKKRACAETKGLTEQHIYEVWPAHINKLFKAQGFARKSPPPYGPECSLQNTEDTGEAPKVLSPRLGVIYQAKIKQGLAEVPFKAQADGDVKKIFWYVNKRYLGSSKSDETAMFKLAPGSYNIKVVDDQGRTGTRHLQVSLVR